jgi:hypothetical protein
LIPAFSVLSWSGFMLVLGAVSLLIGGALGLRFNVLALLAAIFFGGFVTLAGEIAHSSSAFSIIGAFVMMISGLQIGYLSGALGLGYAFRPGTQENVVIAFRNQPGK